MKILAISNLHGDLSAIDSCDLLLIVGDIKSLHDRVFGVCPRLMIFGHVHEARGSRSLRGNGDRMTPLANVSHLDGRGEPRHPPVAFDLLPRQDVLLPIE